MASPSSLRVTAQRSPFSSSSKATSETPPRYTTPSPDTGAQVTPSVDCLKNTLTFDGALSS